METLFKALSDRTRLRLIHLLGDDEVCVCFCVEVLKTNQPKISRHLAYLRRAGLVTARRDGKWTHYRLVEPSDSHAAKIFSELRESLASNPQMQSDKARLGKICCTPRNASPKHVVNAALQFQDAHQTAPVNR
jgi:ArsR family transcriptional regulator